MATQQATNLIPSDVLFKSVLGSTPPLNEGEEDLGEANTIPTSPSGFNNNVFCTLSDPSTTPSCPSTVVQHCDYFIYNINDNDLQVEEALWIAEKLYEESDDFEKRKVFVLLSTVLTWSQIQHLPDANYFRRKAHRHYIRHIAAEKEIKRLGTLDGWLNQPALNVIGDGKNFIPTIHVNDLASIVYKLLNLCPTTHYILAVDDGYNTLLEIVTAISEVLTTGKVKHISVEEAKRMDEFTQKHIDSLTLNLRLEAQFVHENLPFKWASESGLVASIQKIVKEFKLARGLLPIRLCVLGPPLSGKSKLAQLLSEYYSVPHIHVKEIIESRIKELVSKVFSYFDEQVNSRGQKSSYRAKDNNETEEEAIDEDYDAADDDEVMEEMEEIEETNEGEEGEKIKEPDPQAQVAQLSGERAARERSIPNMINETDFLGKVALSPNPNSLPRGILPACVIFLQATDAFLFNRVLRIPNDEVRCSHNDEEGFLRRLLIYRHSHAGSEVAALMASDELRKALNSDYLQKITAGEASTLTSTEQIVPLMAGSIGTNSLCAFFEDRGVRAFNFDVATDTSGVFNEIERKIRTAIGPPRNYGPTAKTLTIRDKIRLKEAEERRTLEKEREAEEFRRREVRKREFSDLLERVRTEEDEELLEASKPLREFLGKFVMPTLSKGIFECIWRRPEDPVDYLLDRIRLPLIRKALDLVALTLALMELDKGTRM
ncbi:unnamed protein product [Hydatigera taeniaeformis]|uniref:Adenylate kinase 7 n=1 Tax=Hydatigena taeniaeformis TaxID=6205 RepID=A0A0R3WZT6_HYDTA|nr:unnamed protein product [Hydatigera taeniaeformis]